MKNLQFVLLFLVLSWSSVFAGDHYNIGIKHAGAFAYQEDGQWKGISVSLIKLLADEMGFEYSFIDEKDINGLMTSVQNNDVDLSIAAISMTPKRERIVDLSHPYASTPQGVLIKKNGSLFLFVVGKISLILIIFITCLYVVGTIISKLDPNDAINNPHKGAWFTLVTFTTTGYGDYVPANARSKVAAGILMVASMFLIPIFTMYMTMSATIKSISNDPVTISNLYHSKVGAVEGSTGDEFLTTLGIKHHSMSMEEGIKQVISGKLDAFVQDKLLLDFEIKNEDNNLETWPIGNGQEWYAIAFPQGSKLTEEFNRAILKVIDSSEWKTVIAGN